MEQKPKLKSRPKIHFITGSVKLCTGHKLRVTRVFFKRANNATFLREHVTCKLCKNKLRKMPKNIPWWWPRNCLQKTIK